MPQDTSVYDFVGLPRAVPDPCTCTTCGPDKRLRHNVGVTLLGEPLAWAYCADCATNHCAFDHVKTERESVSVPGRTQRYSRHVRVCTAGKCGVLHYQLEQRLRRSWREPRSPEAREIRAEFERLAHRLGAQKPPGSWARIYASHLLRVVDAHRALVG